MNMLSPQRQKLVVIGNGMAGMRTVAELLKRARSASAERLQCSLGGGCRLTT